VFGDEQPAKSYVKTYSVASETVGEYLPSGQETSWISERISFHELSGKSAERLQKP